MGANLGGGERRRRAAAFRRGEEAERNRLFGLYERDPEQFAAIAFEARETLRKIASGEKVAGGGDA